MIKIKTGFPNRFLGFPIGWKNLGKVLPTTLNDGKLLSHKVCTNCRRRLKLGKQDKEFFYYCRVCEIAYDIK